MAERNLIKCIAGLLGACALFLLLIPWGCGSHPAQVTGKITYKGQPLTSGSVTFVREDGRRASTAIGEDGFYQIDDAPVGLVKIKIVSHPRVPPGFMNQPGPSGPPRAERNKPHVAIPERYENHETSGLTHIVQKGSKQHDIVLDP